MVPIQQIVVFMNFLPLCNKCSPETSLSALSLIVAMIFLWLQPLLLARSILAANCYHPDGQMFTYEGYAPCKPTIPGGASMCCATNRVNFPDECSPDGLCRNGGDIYRDDCTDPTWKSPGCLQLCIAGFGDRGQDVGNLQGQPPSHF